MSNEILLRDVIKSDLPIFFEQQRDPEANHMAAFTAKDPADRKAFMAHWARLLSNKAIIKKTILFNGQVAGNISHFEQFGRPSVGYWLGKEYWGRGLATAALLEFLRHIPTRPLYARAAKDNIASIRVLEKGGFTVFDEDRGYSYARGKEVEEVILKLEE